MSARGIIYRRRDGILALAECWH